MSGDRLKTLLNEVGQQSAARLMPGHPGINSWGGVPSRGLSNLYYE